MENEVEKTEPIEKPDESPGEAKPDLKSVRESRGLSLKDVFERTRISPINLDAIEKEDFHLLPPPVFTKAFIKTYARTLGIDSTEILSRYEQFLKTLEEPPPKKGEVKTPSATDGRHSRYILWGLSILAGVGIIVFSLFSYKSDVAVPKSQIAAPSQPTPEAKPPESTIVTAEVKSESPGQGESATIREEKDLQQKAGPTVSSSEQKSAERPKLPQEVTNQHTIRQKQATGETYRLTMEANELTWIRMTAGENPPQEMLLRPGEKIEQSASNFILHIGNAGGITIDFHGKSLGNLGRHGQVIHLKLP
jgi:cytoskeletal protein RodZ